MIKIYDGRTEFYQWDLDRKIVVSDTTVTEVHFCNKTSDCSLVVEVKDGLADVPNILLQTDWPINVYLYCGDCYTKEHAVFKVNRRSRPDDYVYTETELLTVKAYCDEAVETAKAYTDEKTKYLEPSPYGTKEETWLNINAPYGITGNKLNLNANHTKVSGSLSVAETAQIGSRDDFNIKMYSESDGRYHADYIDINAENIRLNGDVKVNGKAINGSSDISLENINTNSIVIGDGEAVDYSIAGGTTNKAFIADKAREIFGNDSTVNLLLAVTKLNPSKAEAPLSISLGANNISSEAGAITFGFNNTSSGWCSTAMGALNEVTGSASFIHGYKNKSTGDFGIAFGQENTVGNSALAIGNGNTASGKGSIALGNGLTTSGEFALAEGIDNTASGKSSHAEGKKCLTEGEASHAEGYNTKATQFGSHAEGGSTEANGLYAHAEGVETKANKQGTHTEGYQTEANANWAHAEGWKAIASGEHSHAQGSTTLASGMSSHAEGWKTQATNEGAHAQGYETIASGEASFAGGNGTIASANFQTALGTYNEEDENALFIIGNGTDANNRSNVLAVCDGYIKLNAGLEGFVPNFDIQITGNMGSSGHIYTSPQGKGGIHIDVSKVDISATQFTLNEKPVATEEYVNNAIATAIANLKAELG